MSSPPPTCNKKTKACHFCRYHHLGCDGQRPCGRCVDRKKPCFEYDKNLIKAKKPRQKRNKHVQEQSIDEELKQKEVEIEQLRLENERLQQEISELKPRNEFAIDLWNPPTQLRHPILIIDTTTLKIIGCNDAVRKMFGFSELLTRSEFDIPAILPKRFRSQWNIMYGWILSSCYKLFQSRTFVALPDGSEICTRMATHFHNSFALVEMEPIEEFSDEFIVDDFVVQPSFRMPAKHVDKKFTIPVETFLNLLNVFCNAKQKFSPYSDKRLSQEHTILELYMAVQQLLPVTEPFQSITPVIQTPEIMTQPALPDSPNHNTELLSLISQYEEEKFSDSENASSPPSLLFENYPA